jgi:hypothetical protein
MMLDETFLAPAAISYDISTLWDTCVASPFTPVEILPVNLSTALSIATSALQPASSALFITDMAAARREATLARLDESQSQFMNSILSFPDDARPFESMESVSLDTIFSSTLPDSLEWSFHDKVTLSMSPIIICSSTDLLTASGAAQHAAPTDCRTPYTSANVSLNLCPIYSCYLQPVCQKGSEPGNPDAGRCVESKDYHNEDDLGRHVTLSETTAPAGSLSVDVDCDGKRFNCKHSGLRADDLSGQLSLQANGPVVLDDYLQEIDQRQEDNRENPRRRSERLPKRTSTAAGIIMWADPLFKVDDVAWDGLFALVVSTWMQIRDLPQLRAIKVVNQFDKTLTETHDSGILQAEDIAHIDDRYKLVSKAALRELVSGQDKKLVSQLQGYLTELRHDTQMSVMSGNMYRPTKRRRKS